MQRETTLSRWCARIIEACWVLALTLIPIYFNLFTARHFEPDKATTLRSLVVIAAAFGIIRGIEALSNQAATALPVQAGPGFWRRLSGVPLVLPTLIYSLVFVFTTFTSVVPATSFWGSYQRLQGTYTNLSYILLFVLILVTLRTRAQLERIVTITLISGATAAGYGVLQHFQLDPLPWKGDVIARVASTLGNSIFVAAYLIMVVPLALYRFITDLSASRKAPPSERPQQEWLSAVARLLLLLCGVLLLLAVIKFGAAVRTVDTRYWWVFPGAVASVTAFWWLLTIDAGRGRNRIPLWPAFVMVGFLLIFSGQFVSTQLSTRQVIASAADAPNAADWWIWLLVSLGCGLAGYIMALLLPQLPQQPSRLSLRISAAASGMATLLIIVAIIFTQSRGPFLGLAAGVVVFFTLLLWLAQRYFRAQQLDRLANRLRALLVAWLAVAMLAAAFLITFNLSDAPVFAQLREVPYIGRMGKLLEVNSGTGLVRRLIWTGDTYGKGAVGLIISNPLRTLIGWGPESMFVAYSPFFPPSLADIESRGASPDRSHMAYLDELLTKGLIGLFSYLFVIVSFFVLAIRLMLRSKDWNQQIFYIATLSAVICHVAEGITGIPIVATLMMLWVVLALTVTGGALDGHYQLRLRAEPLAPAPEAAPPAEQKRRNASARVVGRTRIKNSRLASRTESRLPALLAYAALLLVALWFTWTVNVAPVYADMRFQEGQGLLDRAGMDLNQLVVVLDDYIGTVRSSPGEDFYYLSLGRALMTTSDALRSRGVALGDPDANVNVQNLFNLYDQAAVASFLQRSTPLSLMSYAEAVLLKAHDLNPLNKDHFANLGRLNSYWYNINHDPERLRQSLHWYEQVSPVAPNDVTLINERAGVLIDLGGYAASMGDQAGAKAWYDQAVELLNHSQQLDARYGDTYLRLGEIARLQGDFVAATDQYVQGIVLSPALATSMIQDIVNSMADQTAQIIRLRDAFATAAQQSEERLARLEADPIRESDVASARNQTALFHSVVGLLGVRAGDVPGSLIPYQRAALLLPSNVEYGRNYTIVLSDTRHYAEALTEANRILATLQASGSTDQITQVEQLITMIQRAQGAP